MSKLAALAVAIFFYTSPLFAQDTTIRMQVAALRVSNIDTGASTFIDRVNTLLTGVRLTRVETTSETLARVRRGEVDLALVPSAQLAASDATSMAIFELPFFFADLPEVRAFQVAGLGDAILANVARVGVVGLAYWNSGMNQLASVRTATASPQRVGDLLGRKIISNVSPIGSRCSDGAPAGCRRSCGIVGDTFSAAIAGRSARLRGRGQLSTAGLAGRGQSSLLERSIASYSDGDRGRVAKVGSRVVRNGHRVRPQYLDQPSDTKWRCEPHLLLARPTIALR